MIVTLRRTMAPAAVAAGLLVGLGTVSAAGSGALSQTVDRAIGVLPAAAGPAVQAVGTEVTAPVTHTSQLSGLDVPPNSASPSVTVTPPSAEPVIPTARPASSERPAWQRTTAAPRQASSAEPDTGTTPAPTAVGAAYGVLLGPAGGCISCSGSVAGADGSSAHAVPIRILSTDIGGGDSTTNGHGSGAIIATPANPLLSAALGSWMTSAEADRSGSSAKSRAALGDVALGSGLVSAAALEASSDAQYDGASSAAHFTNNGFHITAADGAVDVILLHTYSCGGRAPSVVVPPVTLSAQTGSGASAPSPATGSVSAAAVTHATPSGPGVPRTGTPLKLGGAVMIAAGVALLATAILRRRHLESAA